MRNIIIRGVEVGIGWRTWWSGWTAGFCGVGFLGGLFADAALRAAEKLDVLHDDHRVVDDESDGDGQAETRHVFLAGLHSPFGMALVDGRLYVANADAVV